MKKLFIGAIIYCLTALVATAQDDIRVKQEGKDIIIEYDLERDAISVKLYVSKDDGKTFQGPMEQVSGDIENVTAGSNKQIRWNVIKEWGELIGNVRFKLKEETDFTDPRDGNTYNIIKIGNQVWMAENLRYLPSVVGPEAKSTTTPYYYVYGYNSTSVSTAKATTNYQTYGVLYNWEAARSACPAGWHLPTDAEWKQLTDYLGGERVAGGKLKETGTTHWKSPNTRATNETGFTALPGGWRYYNGDFGSVGYDGYWWSATERHTNYVWCRNLSYYYRIVYRYSYSKEFGCCVRCVRD